PETGRRVPADRHAAIVALRYVEAAIDHHREAQAGAGAELQKPHAAFAAVTERHQPDAGKLREGAGARRQLAACPLLSVELDHDRPLSEAVGAQLAVEELLGAR